MASRRESEGRRGGESRRRASAVQAEIRQSKPFRSPAQEATVALLRTASVVGRAIARVLEPSGLSLAQYNALRIVRGAGAGGIPTLAIRERMIEEGTTITRLLDKLEEAVASLGPRQIEQLITLLDAVRAANAERGAARTATATTTAPASRATRPRRVTVR